VAGFERLTMADLDFEIEKKSVDTILVAFSDLQGRLVGRRCTTEHFLSEVMPGGMRMPSYLLTLDAASATAPGFALSATASGLGDLLLRLDMTALFRMPWEPGTVGVLGDLEFADGTPVSMSPRTILRRQTRRLEMEGQTASLAVTPQFTVLRNGEPAGRREAFLRRVRQSLIEAPVAVDATTALLGPGRCEIAVRPGEPLAVADSTIVLRNAVKELALDDGMAATFMARYDDRPGASCHLGLSIRGMRGGMIFSDRYGDAGLSEVGKAFVAGILEHAAEVSLLNAPHVNSYRRFSGDPLSPSTASWGEDNRTCAISVVGGETALRIVNRIPGSDANPYLTVAAMLASGLDGITHQRRVPNAVVLDAGQSDAPPLPASLADALTAWSQSEWVRATFGPEVQDHYANLAQVELDAARAAGGATPEWERNRYFDGC
jgi:glutamine synthetase